MILLISHLFIYSPTDEEGVEPSSVLVWFCVCGLSTLSPLFYGNPPETTTTVEYTSSQSNPSMDTTTYTTTFSGCMPADPANTKIGNPCVWLAGWLSLRVVSLPEENSTIVNGHLNLLQIRYTMPVNCDAPDDMARMIII